MPVANTSQDTLKNTRNDQAKLVQLPLRAISPFEHNPRTSRNPEYDRLVASIQSEEPIFLSSGEVEYDEPLDKRKPCVLEQRTCSLRLLECVAGASSNAMPLQYIGLIVCELGTAKVLEPSISSLAVE